MPLPRHKGPDTLGLSKLYILPFLLLLLLAGCGDVEHDGYYPSIHSIKVAVGKDHIDVTIQGQTRSIDDFISDVEVIKVGREIILIPIVGRPPRAARLAYGRFEETVRIDGLQRGQYLITVMGRDEATGERTVIEKKVEVK